VEEQADTGSPVKGIDNFKKNDRNATAAAKSTTDFFAVEPLPSSEEKELAFSLLLLQNMRHVEL
jgi:hypothetical protein